MKIGIIGLGAMGSGIAQLTAREGFDTFIYDNNSSALSKAASDITENFKKIAEKGKMTSDEVNEALRRIYFINNFTEFSECDLVLEAVVEDLTIKKQVLRELEMVVSKECILATNTSSFTITAIAAACKNPERVIGIHFFNPAAFMPLVEIIPAMQTDNSIIKKTQDLVSKLKKTIVLAKDTPGFIVNRIARPFYGESFRIYEEGIADFKTIDFALKSKGNFKMGPFELSDFIGHDVNYNVTESIWASFYFDSRYKPSLCQKQLLDAGYLGRKTGKGFYSYSEDLSQNPCDDELANEIFERVIVMLINEASDAVHTKIASNIDIETAIIKGLNYPKGLLQWANDFGISKTVNILDTLYEKYKDTRYRCSVLLREMSNKNILFDIKNK